MRKLHSLIVGILFLFITVGVGTADTEYIPPTPINLTNTTGNYWVNHTWEAGNGNGNVTNLFNVSVNGNWDNETSDTFYNHTNLGPDIWSNISIYAYNSSGNGTLSLTNISQDTQAPSAPIPTMYMPPSPINLINDTGKYWVNHSWGVGEGNVTNLFNVSVNGNWDNETSDTFYNHTNLGPDIWSNISVYAYNTSGSGTLNVTYISQNIKAPSDATPPTADAGPDKTVNEDTAFNFDGSGSSDDVDIFSYSWDFDVSNGITVDANGPNPTHSYSNPSTYTVTLIVSDAAGNSDEDTLTVTVKEVTTPSSSSGGGGSTGTSGEAFENIVCTETDRRFISKDQEVSFNFELEGNYVKYVNFTGLSSFGKEATKVEILNHTSSLVSIDAPDVVFKNLNVWIGSMGMMSENKVLDPTISFYVDKSWVKDNDITLNTIYFSSYDDSTKKWEKMSTQKIGEDSSSYYFKASLPLRTNIGPMAISGRTSSMPVSFPTPTPSVVPNQTEPEPTPEITPIATPITWTSSWKETIPGFQASITILTIIVLYFTGRKRD